MDTYAQFAGKSKLENCALHCLNIIEKTISQQDLFFDAHFAANCSILISGINKLLLGINYRSGKPDHMLNIVKYVTYNSWLPRHSLIAVRILTFVARQPNVNAMLLGEFTRTTKLANDLRHGFVECLESDLVITNDEEAAENSTDDQVIELTIKEEIIKLLEDCLPQSAPNLAHYLLGFDITKDIRTTLLQQPGVLDYPSHCMKSLVTIMDDGINNSKSGLETSFGQQRLLQNAYRLLYALCSNQRTTEVVLRFLRACNDFLKRHVSALPFRGANNPCVLNQMTGLLKCVAIELKITSVNNQFKQFEALSSILLGVINSDGSASDETGADTIVFSNTLIGNNSTFLTARGGPGMNDGGEHSAGLLICKLLECLDFDVKQVERQKWDFFDNTLMEQLFQVSFSFFYRQGGQLTLFFYFQNCLVNSDSGPKLINIKKLHEILRDELNTVQSSIAAGQRQLILLETENILKYAIQLNLQKNIGSSTVRFLDAWGQVTEILFTSAPLFAIPYEVRGGLIIEILQALLKKVN